MRKLRILIAEDEPIIRLDLRALLEASGHEVCGEARDGREAVALARELEPDLAVMDVKMPALDGIEAAARMLDERPLPIVLLTAYGDDELVSRAVGAGVFAFLGKPFREQDLLPAIQTAFARYAEQGSGGGVSVALPSAGRGSWPLTFSRAGNGSLRVTLRERAKREER